MDTSLNFFVRKRSSNRPLSYLFIRVIRVIRGFSFQFESLVVSKSVI